LGSAGYQPAGVGSLPTHFFGKVAEKGQASCLRSPEKTVSARRRKSEPDWYKHARRVRYPENSLQHAFYFFGVGEADGAAGEPASSTAKVQCVSTFLPSDFASTITLHLSRNFFVT